MSIIHEALKKAEREREPRPTGLPLYGRVRTAPRRWHWRVATAMLICLSTLGAVSTGIWLHSHGENLSVKIVRPSRQSLPAVVLGGEAQTAPQTLVTHLPPNQE